MVMKHVLRFLVSHADLPLIHFLDSTIFSLAVLARPPAVISEDSPRTVYSQLNQTTVAYVNGRITSKGLWKNVSKRLRNIPSRFLHWKSGPWPVDIHIILINHKRSHNTTTAVSLIRLQTCLRARRPGPIKKMLIYSVLKGCFKSNNNHSLYTETLLSRFPAGSEVLF